MPHRLPQPEPMKPGLNGRSLRELYPEMYYPSPEEITGRIRKYKDFKVNNETERQRKLYEGFPEHMIVDDTYGWFIFIMAIILTIAGFQL